ncbi:hypothetical protein AZZ65_002118 [Escherichia coli]|nr:hypothetical protein AZZ65_002118 [Escherichia coli]
MALSGSKSYTLTIGEWTLSYHYRDHTFRLWS